VKLAIYHLLSARKIVIAIMLTTISAVSGILLTSAKI